MCHGKSSRSPQRKRRDNPENGRPQFRMRPMKMGNNREYLDIEQEVKETELKKKKTEGAGR